MSQKSFQEFEEESFDDEPEPMARSGKNVAQPEAFDSASQISMSSNYSGISANGNQMNQRSRELDILVQSTLAKRPATITVTPINKAAVDAAVKSGDLNEMLNQANIMITNLSLQFGTIRNKIDANEAAIAKIEQAYREGKRSSYK